MLLEEFKKKMPKIPDTPGVYFFLRPAKPRRSGVGGREILYIGKATSLRDRTRSYFTPDIASVRSTLIAQMVALATRIEWRQTDSVLEALILEANLVRTHKPKYNTDLKDDKSFNYVVVTKEHFPQILLVRGKELEHTAQAAAGKVDFSAGTVLYAAKSTLPAAYTFGPFPHGAQLKEALRIIRKIFPYRDHKCIPAETMLKASKRPKACFNRHIGLCPGVCTGEISKVEYAKIVRRIVLLFQGKKSMLLKGLERDMKQAAKDEDFDQAITLRKQIFAFNHIQDVSLIKNEYRSTFLDPAQSKSLTASRIEAYDVAHLQGSAAVGVMTVVQDGLALKSDYRKFKIQVAKAGDDPGALKEILSRRLGHSEWPMPRLIVVDGATAQINAAHKVLHDLGISIPIVGVVKDEKHRPREIRGDKKHIAGVERDILLANAEAHRFAIGYHRSKSRKELLS